MSKTLLLLLPAPDSGWSQLGLRDAGALHCGEVSQSPLQPGPKACPLPNPTAPGGKRAAHLTATERLSSTLPEPPPTHFTDGEHFPSQGQQLARVEGRGLCLRCWPGTQVSGVLVPAPLKMLWVRLGQLLHLSGLSFLTLKIGIIMVSWASYVLNPSGQGLCVWAAPGTMGPDLCLGQSVPCDYKFLITMLYSR